MNIKFWILPGLALCLGLLPGCGSGSSTSSTAYAAKCAEACKLPATGPCAGASAEDCQSTCRAMTEGLKVECVQCIVEHSSWDAVTCSCNASGACSACHGGTCIPLRPGDKCPTEACHGFDLENATSSTCAPYCGRSRDGG